MQREDVHRSSTTDMPIVESVENVRTGTQINKQIKTQFVQQNDDFFFDIFRLEIGNFSSEHRRKVTFWHWEYNRQKRLLSKYMKRTIIMSRKVTNILFK